MNPIVFPGERLEDLDLAGLQIIQDPDFFCFGIDAVLLAWYASRSVSARSRTADLGTGSGIIPLLLYGRTQVQHIDALEIQEDLAALARRNVALNRLEDVIHIFCRDLRDPGPQFTSSYYDVITCNPPYMRLDRGAKNARAAIAQARHELTCTMTDVALFARKTLKDRGKLFLIQRADRLGDIMVSLRAQGLEVKTLRFVHPYAHKPANLVLVQAMKKGKPGLIAEPPLAVYNADGSYTAEINAIYGSDGPRPR
jgi:tRNA1Val (adenine37-N6)-methyltransferase